MKVKMKAVWKRQATQVMVVTREQEREKAKVTASSQEADCTEVNLGTDSDFGQETAGGECPQDWVIKFCNM